MKWDDKCKTKKQGLLKKYHALSVINQIMPQLIERLNDILPLNVTTGYETKLTREKLSLIKNYYIDAYCIALSCVDAHTASKIENTHDIRQFRRHDRQICHRMLDRTYKLNGKIVCKNRHKRTGQTINSLEEFAAENLNEVSKLTVNIGRNVHKSKDRIYPGAVFLYAGKRYICEGTSRSTYFLNKQFKKGFVRIDKCKIIKQNEGLVFV